MVVPVVGAVFYRFYKKTPQVLLFRRAPHVSGAGFWEFPGGKIEAGESETDALQREIQEELGISAKIYEKIAEHTHQYPTKKIHLVLFWAELGKGTIQLKDHDDFVWVNEQEILSYNLAEADRPFVSECFRLLNSRQK